MYPSDSVSLATPTDSRPPGDCVRLVSVRSVFKGCEEQTLGIASGMVLECLGPVLRMDSRYLSSCLLPLPGSRDVGRKDT